MANIGAFGDVVFTVSAFKILTFDNYKRTTKHRYAEHNIINYTPKLESLGPELQELSLEILLHRQLGVNPKTEADKLRKMCNDAEANFLIIGAEVIGGCLYVIEEVSESADTWDGAGNILISRLNVKFKQYETVGDF